MPYTLLKRLLGGRKATPAADLPKKRAARCVEAHLYHEAHALVGGFESLLARGPVPAADPALGRPDHLQAVRELGQGRPANLRSRLALGSLDERQHLLMVLEHNAEELGPEPFDAWCAQEPTCAEAFLAAGCFRVRWAWQARTSKLGKDVTAEQFELFEERLLQATRELYRARDLRPGDPLPFVRLLVLARAVGLGRPEQQGLLARAGDLYPALEAYLICLTAKWGGSHAEMFEYARRTAQAAPEGSEAPALVALAHIERWLFADDPGAYCQDPAVRAEVVRAYEKSLGSPLHQERSWSLVARNQFAFWFYLTGDPPRLADQLARLGGCAVGAPWYYLSGDTLEKAWKLAQLVSTK